MHSLRYLNTILTILALLLTLNLWTAWTTSADGPGGNALTVTQRAEAQGRGIPNAGAQRNEIIDLLKKLNTSVAGLEGKLTDGKVKVQVVESEQDQQPQPQD